MLVLTRRKGEQIRIGENVFITITDVCNDTGKVRVGIDAPQEIEILRTELIHGHEQKRGLKINN